MKFSDHMFSLNEIHHVFALDDWKQAPWLDVFDSQSCQSECFKGKVHEIKSVLIGQPVIDLYILQLLRRSIEKVISPNLTLIKASILITKSGYVKEL